MKEVLNEQHTLSFKRAAMLLPTSESSQMEEPFKGPRMRKTNRVGIATSVRSAMTAVLLRRQKAMTVSVRKSTWPTSTLAASVPFGSFFVNFLFG